MSHISTVKVQIKRPVHRILEHAMKHIESYTAEISDKEIVLTKVGQKQFPITVKITEDGITLTGDNYYNPGLEEQLKQAYIAEANREALVKQGYGVTVRRVEKRLVLIGAQ